VNRMEDMIHDKGAEAVARKRLFLICRPVILLLFLLLVSVVAQGADRTMELYVSLEGSTQADGSMANPYGSLPEAVDAVRALRRSGNTEPVVIYLREGRHQLNETLVLGIEDGVPSTSEEVALPLHGAGEATGPAHLTFAAYPGEHPVVSAGVTITGWKRLEPAPFASPHITTGKVWVADMPEGMERFYTLYDGQGRLNRARNAGFLPTKTGDRKTLHFPEGGLKNWDNLEDVEIQVRPYRPWVINILPLASVDESSGIARTGVSATYEMGNLPPWVHNPSGSSVWVENIIEALDEPGEWVVNTKTRKIYLWPSDPAQDGSPQGILAPSTSPEWHCRLPVGAKRGLTKRVIFHKTHPLADWR